MPIRKKLLIALLLLPLSTVLAQQKAFIHPGIAQSREDLEYLKKKIAAGDKEYTEALDRLKSTCSPDFIPQPFTHVIRGPYGRPSIGGNELAESARQAYGHALLWYLTGEKAHAQKAIEILNAWSQRLWDLEGNDAKLLAAWTGHVWANAAEIMRYSGAGWKEEDILQFKRMLLEVYYPLIRNFFPEANGNWDGAFIDSMLGIGIFCDSHEIFDKAVSHFLRGKGNGGITKYVYPDGQCQESTRDQGHTQLGLGEFAGACQIAWTQGVDLYGAAGNRLALGFEYTAKYMLGEDVPAYGLISPQSRGHFSTVYDAVYQHYHFIRGLAMPYTLRAADSTRQKASIGFLAATRAPRKVAAGTANPALPTEDALFGATDHPLATPTSDPVTINPGSSIQDVLDAHKDSGVYIILRKGVHTLAAPLRIYSGCTLAGEGRSTILFLDPRAPQEKGHAAIINGTDSLHDVMLRDFVVEGADSVKTSSDPNQDRRARASQMAKERGGISFSAQEEGQIQNIRLLNITVRNCTQSGVAFRGATGLIIKDCDLSDNGGSVAPGWGLLHNLLLTRVTGARVIHSRLDTSPWGNGIDITHSNGVVISGNEIARNGSNGIRIAESTGIQTSDNFIEGNDADGILLDTLMEGCHHVDISGNSLQYNGDYGIEVKQPATTTINSNHLKANGK